MRVLVCPRCGARGYGDKREPPDKPGWYCIKSSIKDKPPVMGCTNCGWEGYYAELKIRDRQKECNIEVLDSGVCSVCKNETHDLDLTFECWLCWPVCHDKLMEEYAEHCRRLDDQA